MSTPRAAGPTSFWNDMPFYFAIGIFSLDSVANHFSKLPVFVGLMPAAIILLVLAIPSGKAKIRLLMLGAFLCTSFVLHSAESGFSKDNLTDSLYVMLFVSSIFYSRFINVSLTCIKLCTMVMMGLFLPTFFGFNNHMDADEIFNSGSTDLEFLRVYNQGFFRYPHLASYLLTYGSLFWFYLGVKKKSLVSMGVAAGFFLAMIYAGSRTPVVVILLGFVLAKLKLNAGSFALVACFVGGTIFMFMEIDTLLSMTHGTILYQYLSFVKTASSDASRLSRIMIWGNWLQGMAEMDLAGYLFGKGFAASIVYNFQNIGTPIWFHNDFLSFAFSYGVPFFCIMLYIYFQMWRDAYRSNSDMAKLVFYFMALSAFLNGFYKYMPVFLLVIYSLVLRTSGTGVGDPVADVPKDPKYNALPG
ncbi:hypothetical protein [Singulisphaera sp. PoT]|uniref:hypothetical protein n=1 Tax=Singulisphaera sp. PoT TaxID=3411797 RepID=UPI003BF50BC9